MQRGTSTLAADADRGQARPDCKVQPVVMIFDSKPRQARKNHVKKPQKTSVAASGKAFAFVNTSHPGKGDEESRRLVKTHVMQGVLRRKLRDCSKQEEASSESTCYPQDSLLSGMNSPRAPLSYLYPYPIRMEPYMLTLIHDYAGAMMPPESKVSDTAWFPLVMTDAALFHALLCMSAIFTLHDMIVQRRHMLESIRLINDRLLGEGATSDATITAVLFMAKSEYFQGNHNAWSIHMDGVKKIVNLRGGIHKLPLLIQEKIYSTDLLGCIETGATPHFPPTLLPNPPAPPSPHNLPPAILSLVESYNLSPTLLSLLSEITPHTTSPPSIHDTPTLQYRFLSLHSTPQFQHPPPNFHLPTEIFYTQTPQEQSAVIEAILLTSTLLYLCLPHKDSLPPFRPLRYTYLLTRLSSLVDILLTQDTPPQHAEFLLWVCFLGEMFSSSDSLSARAREGSLFRMQMRDVSRMVGVTSWEGVEMVMGGMWGVEGWEKVVGEMGWEIST